MQAVIVNTTPDVRQIAELSPPKKEDFFSSSVKFDDMIKSASAQNEKPSASEQKPIQENQYSQKNTEEPTRAVEENVKSSEPAKKEEQLSAKEEHSDAAEQEKSEKIAKNQPQKLEKADVQKNALTQKPQKNTAEPKNAKAEEVKSARDFVIYNINDDDFALHTKDSAVNQKERELKNAWLELGRLTEQAEEATAQDSEVELASSSATFAVQLGQKIDLTPSEVSESEFSTVETDFELSSDQNTRQFFLDSEKKVSVTDMRTVQKSQKTEESTTKEEKQPSSAKIGEVQASGTKNAQIAVELFADAQQNMASSDAQTAASSGSDFQAMVNNQIQQNVPEIVKAGNILLKDNDVGSIKLILHPESIGSVKIDLQISGKDIVGKIIVQSQEAYDAFKQSADNLRQAFVESGFDAAGLDLAFAGQNQSEQNAKNDNPALSFGMRSSYGDYTEDSGAADAVLESRIFENSGTNSINIVA